MPFTPIYGWPYQSLFDPPDGAELGEDLALAIEATLNGLITGSIGGPIAALDTRIDTLEADTAHYGCRLYKTAQSIPTGAATTISWTSPEPEDTNNFWTSAAPTIITIPSNGTYGWQYNGSFATPASGRTFMSMNITSSLPNMLTWCRGVYGTSEQFLSIGGTMDLAAGDTLYCDFFHSNGVPVNYDAWFQIHRVNVR